MEYPTVHVFIFVAGALSTELPDAPVDTVLEIEETQDLVKRVAVSCFGELVGWHGHGDDSRVLAYIAKVEAGLIMLNPWAWGGDRLEIEREVGVREGEGVNQRLWSVGLKSVEWSAENIRCIAESVPLGDMSSRGLWQVE